MRLNIRVLGYIDLVNIWVGKAVSFLIIPMAGVTACEVVLRYVFASPTIWAFETDFLLLGVYVVLSGGYVSYLKGHVSVDILYNKLNLRRRAILDLVTFVFSFIFCAVLIWQMGLQAWHSLLWKEHAASAWAPPLYPIKLIFPIGFFLLGLQTLAKFVRDLRIAVIQGEEFEY